MKRLMLIAVLLAFGGCRNFVVNTRDRISIDGPVETRVVGEIPPVNDVGPLCPVWVTTSEGCDKKSGRIAVIDVDGVLLNTDFTGPYSMGENPVSLFREKLDTVACDNCVRGVVLRINSPGGGVAAAELMRRDLVRFKERTGLPITACLMDVAAGGAYYLATACDHIIATPATVTGGVGVILNLYNLRDLMGQYNVIPQEVKAGALTDLGTPSRALSPEGRAILQSMADEFQSHIVQEVRCRRPLLNPLDSTALDGRVFTATQAQSHGLVDDIGDLDDAICWARHAASVPRAPAVLYRRKNDPAHTIYALTPNVPVQAGLFPSLPGLDRARMPTFLSVWQPELALERMAGK